MGVWGLGRNDEDYGPNRDDEKYKGLIGILENGLIDIIESAGAESEFSRSGGTGAGNVLYSNEIKTSHLGFEARTLGKADQALYHMSCFAFVVLILFDLYTYVGFAFGWVPPLILAWPPFIGIVNSQPMIGWDKNIIISASSIWPPPILKLSWRLWGSSHVLGDHWRLVRGLSMTTSFLHGSGNLQGP
ncbi:hypothetical protein VNO77_19994 [Canavalia gladiata]|uniref:Uncharacterized protein n=1 Tax=Canavalia gladiata TaxID=3824 RepID=A0AAN9QQ43_CANGL